MVLGISTDAPDVNAGFAKEQRLPFPLLTDQVSRLDPCSASMALLVVTLDCTDILFCAPTCAGWLFAKEFRDQSGFVWRAAREADIRDRQGWRLQAFVQ